jgi:hypothetical protein
MSRDRSDFWLALILTALAVLVGFAIWELAGGALSGTASDVSSF